MNPNQQSPNQPGQFPNQPVPPQPGIQPQVPPQPPIGQPPLGVSPATQPGSGSQMPNYGGSPAGNGSKKGIIIGIVIGAVVLVAGAIALFLVFGSSDENTESSEMPADSEQESQNGDGDAEAEDEDTSDIVSKMNRIASAADMECELLEGEEKREAIGELDDTAESGNEEFYNLLKEAFEDLAQFECERGDREYTVSYPAERFLSVWRVAFEDPIKYGVFSEDALQDWRDGAEEVREICMDDSKRAEFNKEWSTGLSFQFLTCQTVKTLKMSCVKTALKLKTLR